MLSLFTLALLLIAFAALGLQFFLKMRSLKAGNSKKVPVLAADRYRPMLRLLSDDDLAFVSRDVTIQKALRTSRRKLFRSYLRCLTRDYGLLLAGVRDSMVRSGADRPDLARALATNRMLFALAICKVEFRLVLHAAGAGKVDISGLVEALEALRSQVSALTASPLTA